MENDEIGIEDVKKRSVRGVLVLTGRTFILQAISLVAQLFLFAYLGQYEFGVFAIVSAVVNFLVYFSDIGLAAALIQKKEKLTRLDLKTTFTVQQILVFSLVALLFLFSPKIATHYGLQKEGIYLLWSLGISLILSSLKSIPSVLLERKLEFIKLVLPQIIEQIVYNLSVVAFAVMGFGITSFTISVLARSLVGLIVIYIIQPWRPGFALSRNTLKSLFKFGIPYQVNTLLATLKDDGMTLVLGSILSPVGVGILSFAQRIARYPLTFFMDTVTKVTFPAFSRMQDEKAHLERSVTRSIFFICFLVFPSLVGLVILMPEVIQIVPKYGKWEGAIIPLIFISINFGFASATTQLTNLLNAIGQIKKTFYLMIMWTVLTWGLVPFLSIKYGVNGAAFGYSLVGVSSIVAIVIAKRYVNFSLVDSVVKPLFASFIMSVFLIAARNYTPVSLTWLITLVISGSLVYILAMLFLVGTTLVDDVKKTVQTILAK